MEDRVHDAGHAGTRENVPSVPDRLSPTAYSVSAMNLVREECITRRDRVFKASFKTPDGSYPARTGILIPDHFSVRLPGYGFLMGLLSGFFSVTKEIASSRSRQRMTCHPSVSNHIKSSP